jgi:hypothetical protein
MMTLGECERERISSALQGGQVKSGYAPPSARVRGLNNLTLAESQAARVPNAG